MVDACASAFIVRPVHVVDSLDIRTVLDEHDLALGGIGVCLAIRVLRGRRVVHVPQLLAELLIGRLRGAIVDHRRGARIVLVVAILHLVQLLHFGAVLLIASRIRVQLLQVELLSGVDLIEGLVLLGQVLAFVGTLGVQDGILVVRSRLLDAVLEAHLRVVDCVGESCRGSCLYACLIGVLEDVAGADHDTVVVQVAQRVRLLVRVRKLSTGVALHLMDLLLVYLIYEAANVDRVLECSGFGGGGASWTVKAPLAVEVLARAREC